VIALDGAAAAWLLFAVVLALDVVVAVVFVARHFGHRRRERLRSAARGVLTAALAPGAAGRDRRRERFVRRHQWLFAEVCSRTADVVDLTAEQRQALALLLERGRLHLALLRDLHSRDRYRRIRAAVFLPLLPSPAVRVALIRALEAERSRAVKLALCGSLTALGETAAIPTIIDSLAGEPLRTQRSVWGLLSELGEGLAAYFPALAGRDEKEIRLLLIAFAERHPSAVLREYLVASVESRDRDVAHAAFRVLASTHTASLDYERYLRHDDFLIRNIAAESLGSLPTTHSLALLFGCLDDALIRRSLCLALSAIVRARPQHLRTMMHRCLNDPRPNARAVLLEVLSDYADTFLLRLPSLQAETAENVLAEIVRHGKVSDFANFLNRNTSVEIEQKAVAMLRRCIEETPACAPRLRELLAPRLLGQLGLEPLVPVVEQAVRREHPRLRMLAVLLAVGAGAVPAACLAAALLGGEGDGAAGLLGRFFAAFNATFAVYAATLNGLYLLLLIVSAGGVARQARYGALLRSSFLFREGVLPSISIISPAFNEQASIVESVSSLLNLHYPDYEVIVVNDGSRDHTLQELISHFKLERTDVFVHRYLNTQEIRGVYASKRIPELLVIDKANGGKADSLNAGINVARKEYFAGIDADSLLERDALLNLAGMFIYSEEEVVAAGGNILPVNGCTVSRGSLVDVRIPTKPVARLQTVEYLRSFMAGRVGWAALRALLIISGAFGVFHRRRVIDAHGYLTRSEHYLKDTVGEDMELVVRLTRVLREDRVPFAVAYGYNANCWTEVPETFKVLSRQRDRWQRGLLDIVTFHFKLMFNPTYGRTGLVGFPYFLLFEIFGPWLEIEGYLVLAAALALGAVSLPTFLVLTTATILLGLLVTTAALVIAENRKETFGLADKLRLLGYAVLENFGFRQFMSVLRLRAFVRMLGKVEGWGRMERRGMGTAAAK
jgi:peptidoglycan-N-acetylglucosamine deacetylase